MFVNIPLPHESPPTLETFSRGAIVEATLLQPITAMDDLLTTHDVQALLKLDRTTVYRMIKAGRLSGVRVGQQWRFPRSNVEALLSNAASHETANDPAPEPPAAFSPDILPLHCMQAIQDVFSVLAQVGAVTAGLDGVPLTGISSSGPLWAMLHATPAGREYCVRAWRGLAERCSRAPQFGECQPGLGCIHARVELDGQPDVLLITGPFRVDDRAPDLAVLARELDQDEGDLVAAARADRRLPAQGRADIRNDWARARPDDRPAAPDRGAQCIG